VTTLADPGRGAFSALSHSGRVSLHGRPGIFSLSAAGHTAGLGIIEENIEHRAAAVGITGTAGLPLARRYGSAVQHWLTPFVEAGAKGAVANEVQLPWIHGEGGRLHAAGGLRSTLGSYGARDGAATILRAGVVGTLRNLRSAATGRVTANARWAGAGLEGAWFPETPRNGVLVGSVRFGRVEGITISPRASGSSGGSMLEARTLEAGGWQQVAVPWLDGPGWTLGSSVSIPWFDWLASAADVDYDLTSGDGALLGVRGATAYRHGCGCLAVTAWAGQRRGRDGVDAMITLDLTP
jgi:hypothetical protein